FLGHRLIDYRHQHRPCPVVVVEVAAGQHWSMERLKITVAHAVEEDCRIVPRTGSVSIDRDLLIPHDSAHWSYHRRTGLAHTWYRPQALEDISINGRPLLFGIVAVPQVQAGQQYVLSFESRVERHQVAECAEHQPRPGYQHQGHCNLESSEDLAEFDARMTFGDSAALHRSMRLDPGQAPCRRQSEQQSSRHSNCNRECQDTPVDRKVKEHLTAGTG